MLMDQDCFDEFCKWMGEGMRETVEATEKEREGESKEKAWFYYKQGEQGYVGIQRQGDKHSVTM
jgi:hypothetical protein